MKGMAPFRSRPGWPVLVAVAGLGLLPVLAALQYRWIGQVSEAERERMQAGLGGMAARFSRDFNSEVTRALIPPRTEPWSFASPADAVSQYAAAMDGGSHPRLIRRILAVTVDNGGLILEERNRQTGAFQPALWPEEWADLRATLERRLEGNPGFGPRRMANFFGSGRPVYIMSLMAGRPGPPPHHGPAERMRGREFGGPRGGPPRAAGWVLAEIDVPYVTQQLIPEIARRTFGDGAFTHYHLAVIARDAGKTPVFASSGGPMGRPDATARLLQLQMPFPGRGGEPFRPEGWNGGPPRPPEIGGRGPGPIGRMPDEGGWELQLRYRSGSLDQVVGSARRRNLTIGFAVLLLMAAGFVVTVLAAQRAQRLALAQMEFVAGVSHELRTPLAVVSSAADNLADGLVASEQQARRYGSVIRKEARRLSAMVEQILGFAGAQSGKEYDLQPVDVQTLLQRAIDTCEMELREAGCTVQMEVQPELPPVMADPLSLTHAIKNLLSNAVKYSNGKPVVTLRAWTPSDAKTPEVHIAVDDQGIGIDRSELGRIFEPFYRSRKVSSRVHGLGLGLALVKRIVEVHGGRVSVESTPGSGSRFTIRLPALTLPAEETDTEASCVPANAPPRAGDGVES